MNKIVKTENGSVYTFVNVGGSIYYKRSSEKRIWSEVIFGWLKESEETRGVLCKMPEIVLGKSMTLEKEDAFIGKTVLRTGRVTEIAF